MVQRTLVARFPLRAAAWRGLVVAGVIATACSDPPAAAKPPAALADANADTTGADLGSLELPAIDVPASCPGGPGCACASHDECATTVCADDGQSTTGKACAYPFAGGCAVGYVAMTAIAGEGTSVCVPAAPKLCNPCEKDDDCKATGGSGALCIPFGTSGRFCGIACPAAGCPTGYTCGDATSASGAKAKQCQPSEQSPPSCSCSPAAAALQLSTPCQVVNSAGSCGGVRTCGPGGLTACNGKVPSPEACNGQDDDCNAQTDEGPLCDDGDACTKGDVCAASACKPGVAKVCDDGNDCTSNGCNPKTGDCTYAAKQGDLCSDGDPCTVGESCFGAVCKGGVAQACPCATTADCAGQEDGNLCNGTLYCNASKCAVNLASVVVCVDDGKPCTDNLCDPKSGSCQAQNLPDTTTCSDGLPWTIGDNCQAGACTAGAETKLCKTDAQCDKYDDGDLCNGTLFCNKATGVCQVDPKTVVYCPIGANSPCAHNQCQAKTGQCAMAPVNEFNACEDGNPCTTGEACKAGQCVASGQGTCACTGDGDCLKYEDGDLCNGTLYCNLAKQQCIVNPATVIGCSSAFDTACSKAACVPATGNCAAKAVSDGAPCDADGSACTPFDACKAGQCVSDTANVCQCQQDSQCGAWEDGDLCNGTLFCDKAVGKCAVNPATLVQCPSLGNTACSQNLCLATTGKCQPTPVAGPCSDDNACTIADECKAGACLPGAATVCDDANPCTTDSCKAGYGCLTLPNAATCDADSDPCTANDACKGGACLPGNPTSCDDTNPCTDDACKAGAGCVHSPVNDPPCSDDNVCTGPDTCALGNCAAGPTKVCDDGKPCSADSCDPTKGCVALPASGTCSDGDACTVGDACKDGACLAGAASPCDDGNPCSSDVCDAKQGGCMHNPLQGACDDGDVCTQGDACAFPAMVCKAAAVVCDDGNACTDESCVKSKGCVALPNAVTCSDGDPCTVGDVCKGAVCLAGAVTGCDDGNGCTDDACDKAKGCVALPTATTCSDGDACTKGDTCKGTTCVAGSVVQCDDQNPCTLDTCDLQKGCTAVAIGDSSPCGTRGLCTAGQCHLYASTASSNTLPRSNCALDGIGKVWCWGQNSNGTANKNLSIAVAGTPAEYPLLGHSFSRISMAYNHNCGVTKQGGVVCWGYGNQFAKTSVAEGHIATVDLTNVVDVRTADLNCALRNDQTMWCWGYEKAIGYDPQQIPLPEAVSQIAGGGYSQSALGVGGTTYYKHNTKTAFEPLPQLPKGRFLCNGGNFRCVVSAASAKVVACYGSNLYGELGDPNVATDTVASSLAFDNDIHHLACSNYRVCALDTAGQVWCWGKNTNGECNVPASAVTPKPALQTRVKGKVLQLHLGYDYITVRLADGTLWSWGIAFGLGNGGTSGLDADFVVTPVQVIEPTL